MSKKRYMELLLEQIRNKRAKELVAREINSHLEDQEEAYLSQGLTAYDAERRAVLDMGDPVETGVSLDAVHRPKMSWSVVILAAIISALGFFMLWMICKGNSDFETAALLKKQVIYLIIGFTIMLVICKLDYSQIFQRSGILALLYLGFLFLQDTGFVHLFSSTVAVPYLLSIPIFCGLLYKFRKRSWYHLLIPAGFMLASILLMHRHWLFVSYKIVLIFTSAILVTVAVCKEWYPIRKKIFVPILWGCIIGIPALFLLMPYKFPNLFPPYVCARISNWIYPFSIENTNQSMVQAVMTRSRLLGHSSSLIMDFDSLISDYMVVNITARYGLILTCILAVLFIAFCVRLFYLALHQKNQLGMILGLGCSLALTVEVLKYFLMNLGVIPMTNGFLPLFSYGGSVTLISYIFVGILLSIYRNQNLIDETRQKRFRIRLKIEQE